MTNPTKPHNEQERLEALYACNLLDTPEEPEFDSIVKLATQICQCDYALITLVDSNRQWFKAKVGFQKKETPRSISFCAHAILNTKEYLVVSDARKDVRFHDNPNVTGEPNIRFYAGFPLVSEAGYALGTLCVFDDKPRQLDQNQEFALKTLSQQVINLIELRQKVVGLQKAHKIIHDQSSTLERLNQSKGKLISMLSHDVRSSLMSLKTVLGLFKTDDLGLNETLNLIEMTEGSIDSTNELLENLLRWSSTQLDSEDLHLQPISISHLVNETFGLLQNKALLKNNQLENLVPADLLFVADKEIIRFMLRNLLANAIKFTENGLIDVRIDELPDQYKISVSDTGVGMSAEQIEKLFRPKTRSTTKGTSGERGNGIGLQLCQELIARHQGALYIKSEKSLGSTFSFTIPKRIKSEKDHHNKSDQTQQDEEQEYNKALVSFA